MTNDDMLNFERETNWYRLAGMLSVIGSLQVNGRILLWSVTSSDQKLAERIQQIAGCGQIALKQLQGRPPLYYWSVRNAEAAQFFNRISKYLDAQFRDEASLKVTQWLLTLSKPVRRPKREQPVAEEAPVVQPFVRPSLEEILQSARTAIR